MSSRLPPGVVRLADPFREKRNTDSPWTGPVERRPAASYQRASEHQTWWCRGDGCGGFTPRGSFAAKKCGRCGTPRPT